MITSWIIEFIEKFGYLSIFLLIAIENIFPPIPSEVILTFGGFMTTHTKLTIPGVVLTATAGSTLGAAVLYKIGSLLNPKRLDAVIDNYGFVLGLKAKDMHKAFSLFRRFKYSAVFLCRMVPIVRSLISIPAGMTKMKFGVFVLLTTAGTLLWNLLLVSVGAIMGESWEKVLVFINIYHEITYLIFISAAIAYLIYRITNRNKKA
ncbi:MAG: alkaline phosphatase [Clostridia bacterium]|jgi:membrane protein DedA with SNARE-associated domain|nr:alkaline phosphatase [Clostridia bacterium]